MTRALLAVGRGLAAWRRRLVSDRRCVACGCHGPCRRFWRAILCNPQRCVQAVEPDVYVCVGARCTDGSRIKHGTVIGGQPYCYRVDASRTYCLDVAGPAHDPACEPLPIGAQVITGPIACRPVGGCAACPPLSGWYLTDRCPCDPSGQPTPAVVWDCAYVETMLAAGRCPVHGLVVPGAGVACVRPSSMLVYEVPPGHVVLSGPEPPHESCCECCPSCPGRPSRHGYASCPDQWPPAYRHVSCCCGPQWDVSGQVDARWYGDIAGRWCLQRWDTYVASRAGHPGGWPVWTVTERWRTTCEEPMQSHTYSVAAPDLCEAEAWHNDITGRWGLGSICEPQYGHSGQWRYDCTRASGQWTLDQRPASLMHVEWSLAIAPDAGTSGCVGCDGRTAPDSVRVAHAHGARGCGSCDDAPAGDDAPALTLDDVPP